MPACRHADRAACAGRAGEPKAAARPARCASKATPRLRRSVVNCSRESKPVPEEELVHVLGTSQPAGGNIARGSWAGVARLRAPDEQRRRVPAGRGPDVPTRTEVGEFLESVDALRDDAERLEARLVRLEATAAQRRNNQSATSDHYSPSAIHHPLPHASSRHRPAPQIQRVLVRHGLDEIILARTCRPRCATRSTLSPARGSSAARAARAANASGGARGARADLRQVRQALSTRRDLLPSDIADELEKLQDTRATVPGAEARAIIERAYGRPSPNVFEQFDETPLARPPRSRRCTSPGCVPGRTSWPRWCAPLRARDRMRGPRGHARARPPGARLFARGPSPAARRGGA